MLQIYNRFERSQWYQAFLENEKVCETELYKVSRKYRKTNRASKKASCVVHTNLRNWFVQFNFDTHRTCTITEGHPFGNIAVGRPTWALVPGKWHWCRRWFRDPGAICKGSRARNDDGARWAASRRWCSWCRAGCSSRGADYHDADSWWRVRGPRPRSSRRCRYAGSENRCRYHAGSASRWYRHPTAAPAARNRSPPCCWPCLGWRSAPSWSHLPDNKPAIAVSAESIIGRHMEDESPKSLIRLSLSGRSVTRFVANGKSLIWKISIEKERKREGKLYMIWLN